VDVLGSDHAPHTIEEKKKEYPSSPGGMPGVQTLLPVMLNHVHEGRLSLERLVELVCENPRHVFGCKQKGRIELGLDGDFTLVDLKKVRTIENKWIASRSQWTPYHGMKVTGWPIATIIGGELVMQDDQILGTPHGRGVEFEA
jgi:dihydroorotase